MSLRRWLVVVGSVLAIAAAVGCGAVKAESKTVSPCGTAMFPTWSPGGTQIAWYGKRWPLPNLHHASGSIKLLRAFCVSDADGKNLHPLPHTTCSEHCSPELSDPPGQLYWVASGMLYGNDAGIFTIPTGQTAKLVGRIPPNPFSSDTKGDRVAAGASECPTCTGPVKVLSVPYGAVVGEVGGSKFDNVQPSLSPDGSQVVFARFTRGDTRQEGIWAASVDGSHLRSLSGSGDFPLWSPAGDRIAYLSGQIKPGLRLVSPQGLASTTLLRSGIEALLSWSPDGRHIAFVDPKENLALVDLGTKKVRKLLKLNAPYSASSIAWSPDSRNLLVVWKPPAHSGCPSGLWRVPISGAKPHLVHGC